MSQIGLQTGGASKKILTMLGFIEDMKNYTESIRAVIRRHKATIDDPIFNDADALMSAIMADILNLRERTEAEAQKRGMGVNLISKIESDGSGQIRGI